MALALLALTRSPQQPRFGFMLETAWVEIATLLFQQKTLYIGTELDWLRNKKNL